MSDELEKRGGAEEREKRGGAEERERLSDVEAHRFNDKIGESDEKRED